MKTNIFYLRVTYLKESLKDTTLLLYLMIFGILYWVFAKAFAFNHLAFRIILNFRHSLVNLFPPTCLLWVPKHRIYNNQICFTTNELGHQTIMNWPVLTFLKSRWGSSCMSSLGRIWVGPSLWDCTLFDDKQLIIELVIKC